MMAAVAPARSDVEKTGEGKVEMEIDVEQQKGKGKEMEKEEKVSSSTMTTGEDDVEGAARRRRHAELIARGQDYRRRFEASVALLEGGDYRPFVRCHVEDDQPGSITTPAACSVEDGTDGCGLVTAPTLSMSVDRRSESNSEDHQLALEVSAVQPNNIASASHQDEEESGGGSTACYDSNGVQDGTLSSVSTTSTSIPSTSTSTSTDMSLLHATRSALAPLFQSELPQPKRANTLPTATNVEQFSVSISLVAL